MLCLSHHLMSRVLEPAQVLKISHFESRISPKVPDVRCHVTYRPLSKKVHYISDILQCVKSAQVKSFSGIYFPTFGIMRRFTLQMPAFSLNTGKYGPEKYGVLPAVTQDFFKETSFSWLQ